MRLALLCLALALPFASCAAPRVELSVPPNSAQHEVTNAFIDAVTAHYAEREDGELSAPRIKATMTFFDFRYGRMTPAGHTGERIELRTSTRVDEHPGRRGTPRTVYAITAVHPSSGPDPEVEGLGEALAARVVAKLGAGAATE